MKSNKKYTIYMLVFVVLLLVPLAGMLITGASKSESSSAAKLPVPVMVSEEANTARTHKDYLKLLG